MSRDDQQPIPDDEDAPPLPPPYTPEDSGTLEERRTGPVYDELSSKDQSEPTGGDSSPAGAQDDPAVAKEVSLRWMFLLVWFMRIVCTCSNLVMVNCGNTGSLNDEYKEYPIRDSCSGHRSAGYYNTQKKIFCNFM